MDNNSTPLIQVKNLSKSFGENLILNDISMDINKGEKGYGDQGIF